MSSDNQLKQIVEAALLAAGRPLSLDQLQALFDAGQEPDKKPLREVLDELTEDYAGRGIEVREVGSGFRIQVRSEYASWVSRLYAERPPKYSRALLETLALIAYRQPITRGEIEDIRGVSVSTNIVKTLTEREWVRVVGHRDVPGKPALYATTREFLDYFNLKSLSELPTLVEIRDLDSINRELELKDPDLYQPEEQDDQEATGGEAEPAPSDSSEEASIDEVATEAEAVTDYELDPASLIEADPDGETDSGVMHQSPAPRESDAVTAADDLIDFDVDGETDTTTESHGIPDQQQAKRSDETD